jgi:hypothetical protein
MRAPPSRSREGNAFRSQTDFSSSGATTLLSAGTAIAVAQIFPTTTRKFSPSGSIPVAYHHKNCLETVGIVRAVGLKHSREDSQCWTWALRE